MIIDMQEEAMIMMTNAGVWGIRVLKWIVCIPLMILIGVVQAVGTVLTAMSAVVLKAISALMIFVTLLLLTFGLFTWTKTLMVLLIGVSMFWIPEGIALVIFGLTFVQAKLKDIVETR